MRRRQWCLFQLALKNGCFTSMPTSKISRVMGRSHSSMSVRNRRSLRHATTCKLPRVSCPSRNEWSRSYFRFKLALKLVVHTRVEYWLWNYLNPFTYTNRWIVAMMHMLSPPPRASCSAPPSLHVSLSSRDHEGRHWHWHWQYHRWLRLSCSRWFDWCCDGACRNVPACCTDRQTSFIQIGSIHRKPRHPYLVITNATTKTILHGWLSISFILAIRILTILLVIQIMLRKSRNQHIPRSINIQSSRVSFMAKLTNRHSAQCTHSLLFCVFSRHGY